MAPSHSCHIIGIGQAGIKGVGYALKSSPGVAM